jgi:hypothetical protein
MEKWKPTSIKNGYLKKINGENLYEFTYDVIYGLTGNEEHVIDSNNSDYPSEAISQGLTGQVEIEYTYNDHGDLLSTKYIKKTNSILDESALKYLSGDTVYPKSVKRFVPSGETEIRIVVVKAVEYKLLIK